MKKNTTFFIGRGCLFVICLLFACQTALGYDITDKFSVGGILSGAYQHLWTDDDGDIGRGAVSFQPEFSFRPTDRSEFFAGFGFAGGNGLNVDTAFSLSPWAAGLEDDVKDINGRGRNYLLTAGYRHTFGFAKNHTLGLTVGLIDSTDYVDENRYANDEYSQFMNAALTNAPNGFSPSYDIGGAFEWKFDHWSVKGVGMNIGKNDDGNNFNFWGAQLGYRTNASLGEGNYRLIGQVTDKQFPGPDGSKEKRTAVGLSFDQELSDILGAWIRFGWQDDAASIDYDYLYSGGLNIAGKWYGRKADNLGIGYAYLNGGNRDLKYSQVAEIYARLVFNNHFAATLDFQYLQDRYNTGLEEPEGFIAGIRLTAEL